MVNPALNRARPCWCWWQIWQLIGHCRGHVTVPWDVCTAGYRPCSR